MGDDDDDDGDAGAVCPSPVKAGEVGRRQTGAHSLTLRVIHPDDESEDGEDGRE